MHSPQTALEALTWRRLLVSRWPWRSAGYLLATLPVAVVAAALLAVPAAGGYPAGAVVLLVLLGAVLVAATGPLIAVPVASLARGRPHLTGPRQPTFSPGRGRAAGGAVPWLRARYTDPGVWRQTGYVCLLASVVPVLAVASLLAAPLAVVFIASPLLVVAQQPGSRPVALFGHLATAPQALPYVIAGLLLLPASGYLMTLVAGADVVTARALLLGGPAEQLRAELTEVTASRARLAGAFEAERRRIERDLHDGAQQKLVSLTLQLGMAQLDVPPGSRAAGAAAAARDQAKQLMAELRELIHGIQPQILTDLGLPAALAELADSSPVPVTLDAPLASRLPGQAENTAYFIAAEALTNIAKHSGATSAAITARRRDNMLVVEITDNGHGGADPDRGSGLTGLADRVAVAGGRMMLSSPPGGPTLLRAELPCSQN